jgi:hypothetical protein|tara:strand:- start:3974 stop:4117 length:144 start_codon:yes stop_codon:yes gene_type:complete
VKEFSASGLFNITTKHDPTLSVSTNELNDLSSLAMASRRPELFPGLG